MRIVYENANFGIKNATIKELVSRRMWSLVIVLVRYESNRLRVYEKVNWMVYQSDLKRLSQRVLLAIHRFSDPEQ